MATGASGIRPVARRPPPVRSFLCIHNKANTLSTVQYQLHMYDLPMNDLTYINTVTPKRQFETVSQRQKNSISADLVIEVVRSAAGLRYDHFPSLSHPTFHPRNLDLA